MKCPVCGKDEFVKIEKPYHEGMDTFINDYTNYIACTSCGLVLRFAKNHVDHLLEQEYLETADGKEWNSLRIKRDNLLKKLVELDARKKRLQEEAKDDRRTIARDKQIKEELSSVRSQIMSINKETNEIESSMKKIRNK